jgi:acid stress-induced BolA-like protein IbaG/YrbA
MATVTKAALQHLLTRRARLKAPRFKIRMADDKWIGAVISDSFKGMTNLQRQRRMWKAIHAALDDDAARRVGMLLAYTDDEWDEPLEGMLPQPPSRPRARRKAG